MTDRADSLAAVVGPEDSTGHRDAYRLDYYDHVPPRDLTFAGMQFVLWMLTGALDKATAAARGAGLDNAIPTPQQRPRR